MLLSNWSLPRPSLESLLFSTALAVGLTPALLPMIITITLSRGAVRMARKQVIVKQLETIHNLGCMDVLGTDKTDTLTEAMDRAGVREAIRLCVSPSLESIRESWPRSAGRSACPPSPPRLSVPQIPSSRGVS